VGGDGFRKAAKEKKMRQVVIMTMVIAKMLLVCNGCEEEEEGMWISESCREYEVDIRWAVERLNELEGYEVTWIEGVKESDPQISKQKALNDGRDFFYCLPPIDNTTFGMTNIGAGDIFLYPKTAGELLPCAVLHELGHRFLSLGHSADIDAIMYPEMYVGCEEKTEFMLLMNSRLN
jgi:hypothetical protein